MLHTLLCNMRSIHRLQSSIVDSVFFFGGVRDFFSIYANNNFLPLNQDNNKFLV